MKRKLIGKLIGKSDLTWEGRIRSEENRSGQGIFSKIVTLPKD